MRKGPHFRSDRLRYGEIGDIHDAAAPLLELGWITEDHPLDALELGKLLRRAELLALLPAVAGLHTLRKPQLIEQLRSQRPGQGSFCPWCPDHPARLFPLLMGDVC